MEPTLSAYQSTTLLLGHIPFNRLIQMYVESVRLVS